MMRKWNDPQENHLKTGRTKARYARGLLLAFFFNEWAGPCSFIEEKQGGPVLPWAMRLQPFRSPPRHPVPARCGCPSRGVATVSGPNTAQGPPARPAYPSV